MWNADPACVATLAGLARANYMPASPFAGSPLRCFDAGDGGERERLHALLYDIYQLEYARGLAYVTEHSPPSPTRLGSDDEMLALLLAFAEGRAWADVDARRVVRTFTCRLQKFSRYERARARS